MQPHLSGGAPGASSHATATGLKARKTAKTSGTSTGTAANRLDDHAQPALKFTDASIRRGERTIWSNGNFSIRAGSITAIVGTNGAGKTTMMKAELGLLPLASGTLEVLGGKPGSMNHAIGYVPQNYANDIDANLTAGQSVLLGLTGTRFGIHPVTRKQRDQAREAMRFVGIDDKANYRLSELSGGLRQRVAIAQALVSDPKLLMLDEPLANLDLASQRETVQVLARLNRELGMTIQVVAHDLNMLLPILDGAVYLLDGHPHYARMNEVLDADLLTHLYGTTVQVVTTPQGDMFVTPSADEPEEVEPDTHRPDEVAEFHHHHHSHAGPASDAKHDMATTVDAKENQEARR
ncbi:ABC transporter ATP-binding protein [Bifidobacterium sp. ESL0790]|uniref:ABC transporter ATP-binding protein n=1 Tax=Bifidobacterium sp. ESL0790 TaxID=2983233 RepID=UPI0023FA0BEC|nr:ABC transporter ATP-binding protein [Bifidobacterium sp. ESL0790]WEV73034.1 ABC transporter ATP-binding protein [Bifidobacterium sp. ESL0790]